MAFVIGIILAWYKIPLIYIVIIGFVSCLLIYLLMFRIRRYINRKDYFLWGLPVLLLLGFLAMSDRMKPPDMDIAFEEKSDCYLTGEITMIVKKSWGIAYYLRDNRISLPPDNRTFLVEEVIVNTYTNEYQDNYKSIEEHELIANHMFQPQISKFGEYQIGNIITVSGTINKFKANTNPGGFNEYLYYKSHNIAYKVIAEELTLVDGSYSTFHYVLNIIKEKLISVYSRMLPEKEAGTLMAMVLGEKYLLEYEIKTLYQENGISHILAISGLHISVVGAAIYFLLRKLRLGLIASTVISLLIVYSYGILTNFSVSTNRAVVMYGILLFAKLIGKTFDILSALSLSAFLILIQNPMELFEAGFLLSFGAVLGIAVILPSLTRLYEPKNAILKGIYVSVSAQALTLPFVLYYFFQIPTYSVLVNLIILPLTSLLMLTALAAGLVGILSISIGVFIAGGANYILIFYERICKLGSKLPGNLITVGKPDAIRMLVYFVIISIFIISERRYGKKRIILLYIAAVVVLIIPKPRDGLTITMLDVGQGEAIFMESDLGTSYLIDGGSSDVNQVGRYRIEPYLLSRGTDTIDYAIVTHTDEDHISGLMELIKGERITIKHLILPNTTTKNESYIELEVLAKDKSIKSMYVVKGDIITDGKLRMIFLHPTIGYLPSSNNDYSTVISIAYGDFDMLMTGDLEAKGEQELIGYLTSISEKVQTDYDVLKVAHHGSRNSTSEEFLSIIKPELSLISCSKNNHYEHPHTELLKRLGDVGSEVVITYESGAITIKIDGKRMMVEEFIY
ncbi:MAG: DNA internalization-related competence protein ComEC/Rec2 [Herbinix sp.]|nr:DNA internalization-related competence protein ComEC/Rec2 [Herbinix sp.]